MPRFKPEHRMLLPLAVAVAALLGGCGVSAGAGSAEPAGCPALTPLALPTRAPGTGAGGPGGAPGARAPGTRQAGPTPTLAPPPALPPAPAGALRFQVDDGRSTATFRAREQLAGVSFPSDAVGCTPSVTGQLALQPDGTLDSEASRVTVDLRDLTSNSEQRDNFIKSNTIQTSSYPTASFVPDGADGLPSPLPPSGTATFKLSGQLTIHGVTKEQTWDVMASRTGDQISGTATTSLTFEDYGMSPPRVPVVLSVTDAIGLEVQLVATQEA
jgi:polyisoprenoid-binding protein YceI